MGTRDYLKTVKAGVDKKAKSNKELEQMSWDLELDIAILDEAIANYLTVSRRYYRCNEENNIEDVPHVH